MSLCMASLGWERAWQHGQLCTFLPAPVLAGKPPNLWAGLCHAVLPQVLDADQMMDSRPDAHPITALPRHPTCSAASSTRGR